MDYIYFTFDGVSSSKYNLMIKNTGEDLSFPSQPGFENQLVSPLYQGTNYLAGVNKKERTFNFNCWADSLNRQSVHDMLNWLSPDKTGYLILDYNPNYQYKVKLASISDLKHMAINDDETVNYEFTLSFITIGDFAAISRTNFVINTKANPLNADETTFLNPDNLAPIGVWNAATSKIKLFNFASEPMYLTTKINGATAFTIDKNDVAQYTYSKTVAANFVSNSQYGFVKIGSALSESVAGVTATTNVGPMSIESGKPEVLYTTLNTTYVEPTVVLKYTDDILVNKDLTNLYMIIQDGDYGVELLTQEMTEAERQLYITESINEQYNKINRDGSNSNIDKLTFNVTTTNVDPLLEGELRWNAAERTLDIGVDGNNVVLQVGEETYYPRVKNVDTVNIPEGSLVEYVGSLGASGVLLVRRAATSLSLSGAAMGIATETIPMNRTGKVTWFGLVRGIQTNGLNYGETWVDGDMLYNSSTVQGGLSKVKPVAPNNALFVAIVVRAHASSGILFIRPLYFPKLGQLSDIYIANPANNDTIVWNSTNSRWENSNVLGTKADKVQEAWITPTLLNGWEQHPDFEPIGYMKDSFGFVHTRGGARNGTIGQPMFNFASGYRIPNWKLVYFNTRSSSGAGEIELSNTDGRLTPTVGGNAWFSLDGVVYKAST